MHIHFLVNKHLDWAPAPGGTKITQADVDAKRVRKRSEESKNADGGTIPAKWDMRVTIQGRHVVDPSLPHHDHMQTMHETQIVDRFVALAMCGKGLRTRAQVAVECIGFQLVEHLEPHHIDQVTIEGDTGPDETLLRDKIASYAADPRMTPELADNLVERYMSVGDDAKDPSGILALLKAMYVAPKKSNTPAGKKPGKEKP